MPWARPRARGAFTSRDVEPSGLNHAQGLNHSPPYTHDDDDDEHWCAAPLWRFFSPQEWASLCSPQYPYTHHTGGARNDLTPITTLSMTKAFHVYLFQQRTFEERESTQLENRSARMRKSRRRKTEVNQTKDHSTECHFSEQCPKRLALQRAVP
jgi:hypothetical protein